ncbi:DUF2268 domain-containing putative Zn-dependent protease [Cytobacillus sp. IB215665]|uniref:DUF2268 domain-containing putative Zn-dependent protease n=1 Tax=Cytobacillus sp. IB215665 TaxID=3097357 RepID=UPI002A14F2AA|nr:DUF2268 domain-containing putative Zn-dependent protease [Cytobacillus sp. IB215665]MDX8365740.1 DUF2268 domain-containing putative Zn-dependent protease [Cytobacillus sp. IB215665]
MVSITQFAPHSLIEKKGCLANFFRDHDFNFEFIEESSKGSRSLIDDTNLHNLHTLTSEELVALQWNEELIETAIQNVMSLVNKYIYVENVEITVVPALTKPHHIPQSLRIFAYKNHHGNILISVPPNPDIDYLKYVLAHRAFYSSPQNPVNQLKGNFTLADWFKLEGAAQYFSLSFFEDKRWWAYDTIDEERYWASVKGLLQSTDVQLNRKIYYGYYDDDVPTYTGQAFAHNTVTSYIEKYPINSFTELFNIDVQHIFEIYKDRLSQCNI